MSPSLTMSFLGWDMNVGFLLLTTSFFPVASKISSLLPRSWLKRHSLLSRLKLRDSTLGLMSIQIKMHICRDVQKDAYVVYVTLYVYRALASIHLMKGQEISSETSCVRPPPSQSSLSCLSNIKFLIHNICSAFFLVQGQTTNAKSLMKGAVYH